MDDDKKKKSLAERIVSKMLTGIFLIIAVVVVAYIATSIITYNSITLDPSLFFDSTFVAIVSVGALLVVLLLLSKLMKGDSGSSGGAKVKTKNGLKKYYDSHWVTEEELRTNKDFMYTTWDKLKTTDNVGVLIRAEASGSKMHINMYKPIHTLVIGTTGTGKTTQFVNPTIQVYSESKAKPCLVITDPKGELYDFHSNKLRKSGYRVIVFDLKDPFNSTCWNPMTRPFEFNERARNLEKEILIHRGDDPRNYPNLRLASNAYYSEWYEFNGVAFADMSTVKAQISGLRQQLKTEAMEDLKDIAMTLCPVLSKSDPIWESGAKDFILAIMLAMLEDSEKPELGMTKEKFNFYNLAKIANLKDNDPFNPMKSLTDYFAGRDPLSQATQLANQVITNADNTKKSYMGIVSDRLNLFSDLGVCYATHTNEMDLKTFTDQPTALFIKIPDEKVTRHSIASMFISQLYKILVNVANNNGGALKRTVYYILDEFANMPAIQGFDTMITVARSRKIFFLLMLQSYAQLSIKYDEKVAATIKDNCNIHVYIGSNDPQTQEEFSKRCGTITVETESTTSSKGKKDEQSTTTTSVNLDSRPLIYPNELGSLKDKMIVSILRQHPIKILTTPSYLPAAQKFYDMRPPEDEFVIPKSLDEAAIYYDIKERNKKVLNAGTTTGNGAGTFGNSDFGNFDI